MARPSWSGMRAQDFDTSVPLSLFDRPTGVGARDSIYGKGTSTVRSTGPGDLFSLLKDTPRAAGADKARTAAS